MSQPAPTSAALSAALAFHAAGSERQALQAYETALAEDSSLVVAHLNVGFLLLDHFKRSSDARPHFDAVGHLTRDPATLETLAAVMQDRFLDYTAAKEYLDALAVAPAYRSKALCSLGALHALQLRDVASARAYFEAAVREFPGRAACHGAYGMYLSACSTDYALAESELRASLKESKPSPVYQLALAKHLDHRLQRPDEAAAVYRSLSSRSSQFENVTDNEDIARVSLCLAEFHIGKKELSAAGALVRNALKQDALNPIVRIQAGIFFETRELHQFLARREYEKAVSIDPVSVAAVRALTSFLARNQLLTPTSYWDNARDRAVDIVEKQAHNISEAHHCLAVYYDEVVNDAVSAQHHYQVAVNFTTATPEAHYDYAVFLMKGGYATEAREQVQTGLSMNQFSQASGYACLARLALQHTDYKEARHFFNEAIIAGCCYDPTVLADYGVLLSDHYQETAAGLRLLEDSLLMDPRNIPLMLKIGILLKRGGHSVDKKSRMLRAREVYQSILHVDETHSDALLELADLLSTPELAKYTDARDIYKQVIVASPENVRARCSLAELLATRLGMIADGREMLQKILEEDPLNTRAMTSLASAISSADLPRAISLLQSALEVDAGDWRAHSFLAEYLVSANPILAEMHFTKSLELNPEDACGFMRFAKLLVARGDVAAAKSSFEKAVALEPANDLILIAYSEFLSSLPDITSARQVLQRFLALNDRVASAHLALSKLLSTAFGDLELGLFHAKSALVLNPKHPQYISNCEHGKLFRQY